MNDQVRDRACLERIRAGDTRALEDLYDRHNGLLYSVVLRIVRMPQDAEEVLKDAWLQIWRGAGTYNWERGTVGAWLVNAARNQAIDRLRNDGPGERSDPPSGLPVATEDASANAAHRQMSERVRRALDVLGPQHRHVLELAYFAGLTPGEIAERLNSSPVTIKSWTRQALVRLSDLVPQEEWT